MTYECFMNSKWFGFVFWKKESENQKNMDMN